MSIDPESGFLYQSGLPLECSAEAMIVRIPARIPDKHQLLETLARGLEFPSYFGWNWDALDECLRDLSWIQQPRQIVLMHEDIPFQAGSDNRAIYLDILKEAVATWGPNQAHELFVMFPPP